MKKDRCCKSLCVRVYYAGGLVYFSVLPVLIYLHFAYAHSGQGYNDYLTNFMKKTYSNKTASPNQAPSQRQLQVGELIRHALAEVFTEGNFHAGELGNTPITVSEVRIGPDLRNAIAYVMPLGGTKDKKAFIRNLARITPLLRTMVTKRVKLRFSPELAFRLDESFDRASHVETLLQGVKTEDEHES